MDGWIKLHRKFSHWQWFNKSEMVHLFIYLLLNANSNDGKWKNLEVKRGQIVVGLHSLSAATGISIQQIRTCLMRLVKTSEINKESNKQYTIITICNYDSYQCGEKKSTKKNLLKQQSTNNKQEVIIDKSIITWRDDFEIYKQKCEKTFGTLSRDEDLKSKLIMLYPNMDYEKSLYKSMIGYWATPDGWENKRKARSKKINWKTTIINTIQFNLITA